MTTKSRFSTCGARIVELHKHDIPVWHAASWQRHLRIERKSHCEAWSWLIFLARYWAVCSTRTFCSRHPSSVVGLLNHLLTDPSPGSGSEIWQALAVGKVRSSWSCLPYTLTNAIPLGHPHPPHRHHPRVYQRPYRLHRRTCHPICYSIRSTRLSTLWCPHLPLVSPPFLQTPPRPATHLFLRLWLDRKSVV